MIRENDNNNKEYCNCEIAEQLQISEDINNMTDKKNGREYLGYVLEKLKEQGRQVPPQVPVPERKPVPGCCLEREHMGW